MKTWQKVCIGGGVAVAIAGIVGYSITAANKGVVTVQTAKVAKQDTLVSIVTASGEVKPTTYTNISAQGYGRITQIFVKEGDHVKKGDKLLLQENVQANADVDAQSAALNSAESGIQAAEASYKAAQSDLLQQKANLEKARSEEHTSELQSPCNLVCRLLLEKKKQAAYATPLRPRANREHRRAPPNHTGATRA